MSDKRKLGVSLAKKGDMETSKEMLKKAIENGDVDAINDLGVVFDMEDDNQKAEYCYLYAAALGSETAVYNMGKITLKKGLLKKNNDLALKFFRRAMDLGYPEAYYKLATYGENLGYKVDDKTPIDLLSEGSDKEEGYGDLYSCSVELGYRYETGKGVDKDLDKAICYYTRAAKHGCVLAVYNLGMAYINKGQAKEAMEAWKLAAEKGYPDAYASLAIEYCNGDNVEQDMDLYKYYLEKSRELDSPKGRLLYVESILDNDIEGTTEDVIRELELFFKHKYYADYMYIYNRITENYKDKLDWGKIEAKYLYHSYYSDDYDDYGYDDGDYDDID